MLIGYARVSTDEQDTRLQIDALKRAGCEKIYEERASGSRTDRPELNKALVHGRKGDVVVVWMSIGTEQLTRIGVEKLITL
jgi:DNA invertase Pin-like site-specific DNA recombinase